MQNPQLLNPRLLNPRSRARRAAFTLIELMLVLVILAVLAAIVLPKLTGRTQQARIGAAKTGISNISGALNNFEVDAGRFPTTDEGLNALLVKPGNVSTWNGPYLDRVPVDPWEHPYVYRCPGSNNLTGFDILSMGPDGHEGGGDDIDNFSQSPGQK
ncbi:MAG TPA: type II secretion system major pseudopilin GspG [Tepidisphaeraceae bacterium]|nr:type II secretion system major pseudopilin GspG [Tepidisphaeraceae bacterium]